MWVGLLTDRINDNLEESNLINEHALNREPVSLKFTTTRANKYCSNSLLDNQREIKYQILQFILNSGLHRAKVEKNLLSHI